MGGGGEGAGQRGCAGHYLLVPLQSLRSPLMGWLGSLLLSGLRMKFLAATIYALYGRGEVQAQVCSDGCSMSCDKWSREMGFMTRVREDGASGERQQRERESTDNCCGVQ